MKRSKALEVVQELIVVQDHAHKAEEALCQDQSLQIYKDLITRQAREKQELALLFETLKQGQFEEDEPIVVPV